LLQPAPPDQRTGSGGATNGNGGSSSLSVPRLQAPGTSLNGGTGTRVRLPRVSLREQLAPYTNNPDDLFAPPKADRPWKYIVFHHSAAATGSLGDIDREHRERLGWDGCGYHFVIGNGSGSPDGQIEVAPRWSEQKQGVHTRNGKTSEVNEYGIGICLVGDLDATPPTARQITSAQALVAYLQGRYRITPDRIGTHAQLASTPTACPGKYFPAQAVFSASPKLAER
jgi:N-acetyl-anhydromuramyl-L-alanine amidase AmpD